MRRSRTAAGSVATVLACAPSLAYGVCKRKYIGHSPEGKNKDDHRSSPAETGASDSFSTPADEVQVRRVAAALEANGFSVLRASDAAEAGRLVLDLIPEGTKVHHGASQTLEVTGITQELDTSGRYEPVGPRSGAWTARRRALKSAGRPRPRT